MLGREPRNFIKWKKGKDRDKERIWVWLEIIVWNEQEREKKNGWVHWGSWILMNLQRSSSLPWRQSNIESQIFSVEMNSDSFLHLKNPLGLKLSEKFFRSHF